MKRITIGELRRHSVFFEKILETDCDNIDVLIALAEIYTLLHDYRKSLSLDRRIVRLLPLDPETHYNLSCDYSCLGKTEKALKCLKMAIMLGYDDFNYMLVDPDLDNLRRDKRYENFFSRLKKKSA